MADTAAALVIQLSADLKNFQKEMERATGINDKAAREITRRNRQLKNDLSSGMTDAASQINRALSTIGAGFSAAAFVAFARSALEAAGQLKDLAQQSGISATEIQALQFAGIRAGLSFDEINSGLLKFNQTLGDFQQDQGGPGAKAFEELGIKARLAAGEFHSTQDVFKAVIEQLAQVKDKSEQAALGAELFGRQMGPRLVPLIESSGGSIDKLIDSAKAAGVVLDDNLFNGAASANEALNTLFFTISQDGTKAVAAIAPSIKDFIVDIHSNIDAVNDITSALGRWYNWLIDHVPGIGSAFSAIAQAASNAFNPLGTAWRIIKENLGLGYGKLAFDGVTVTRARTLGDLPTLKLGPKPGAADEAARAALERQQALLRILADQRKANDDLVKAQDALNVDLLRGQDGYFAALQKQIDDEKTAKINAINDQERAAILALDRQKGLSASQRALEIKAINDTANARRSAADVEARAALHAADAENIYQQTLLATRSALEQASKSSSNSIELADQLRSGLEDVGTAGLEGFSSMRDAAASLVSTLAQMIIKIYVLKPLLDNILGPSGTPLGGGGQSGGGGIGGILSSIFGSSGGGGGGGIGAAISDIIDVVGAFIGFQSGGYTGNGTGNQVAGLVHKGEYVFDKDATKRIGLPNLTALSRGMPVIPAMTAGGLSAATSGSSSAIVSPNNVKIINVTDASELPKYMATPAGEKVVLNILSKNGFRPTK